jgi:hypothetical protein
LCKEKSCLYLSGIRFSITSQKKDVSYEKKDIYEFIVDDETLIKVYGGEFVWLCGLLVSLKIRQSLEYIYPL